ncbi:Ras, variant 2 [Parelaphostrongylus tenuis]|nr:Ras, variant 2 [Parelaphostrongylus tenuis]
MTRVYYKDAHAAVVVMDSTREQTLEGACRWKADLDQKVTLADGSHVPAILVANKCDMDNQIEEKDLDELRTENGFIAVIRASAKDNFGIQETFDTIVRKIISNEQSGQYEMVFTNRNGNLLLSDDLKERKNKHSHCCGIL